MVPDRNWIFFIFFFLFFDWEWQFIGFRIENFYLLMTVGITYLYF